MSSPFRAMRSRATAFQLATGVLCHHLAMYVWSDVRVEPVAGPSDLTSLNSAAYSALPSGSGPAVRNCDELCIRNGSTPPTHGVGSCTVVPFGATGSQCPGFESGTHWDGPNRPSPSLASIIASAAALPASIPRVLNGSPASTFARKFAYCVASDCSNAVLAASEKLGTVETMFASTLYAAVATAASVAAVAANRRVSR